MCLCTSGRGGVNEPGRPVPSRLHLVRLWEDREERLVVLRCVLSCVRWHGQSENSADLLRLVHRCLVVFRVERFMFNETRNAIEVGLYTHWRWRFLMLRYWGVGEIQLVAGDVAGAVVGGLVGALREGVGAAAGGFGGLGRAVGGRGGSGGRQ